jgi:hypothetical protein
MIRSASSNVKPIRISSAQNTNRHSPLPVWSTTRTFPNRLPASMNAWIFSRCVYMLYVSTSWVAIRSWTVLLNCELRYRPNISKWVIPRSLKFTWSHFSACMITMHSRYCQYVRYRPHWQKQLAARGLLANSKVQHSGSNLICGRDVKPWQHTLEFMRFQHFPLLAHELYTGGDVNHSQKP